MNTHKKWGNGDSRKNNPRSRMRRQAPPRGHRPCCSRRRKQTAWMRSRSKHATQSTLHAFGLDFFGVGEHLSAIKVNGAVIIYCKTLSCCLCRLFYVIVHFIMFMWWWWWWWCCCVKTKLASMHVFPCLMLTGPVKLILSNGPWMKFVGSYRHSHSVDRSKCAFN